MTEIKELYLQKLNLLLEINERFADTIIVDDELVIFKNFDEKLKLEIHEVFSGFHAKITNEGLSSFEIEMIDECWIQCSNYFKEFHPQIKIIYNMILDILTKIMEWMAKKINKSQPEIMEMYDKFRSKINDRCHMKTVNEIERLLGTSKRFQINLFPDSFDIGSLKNYIEAKLNEIGLTEIEILLKAKQIFESGTKVPVNETHDALMSNESEIAILELAQTILHIRKLII